LLGHVTGVDVPARHLLLSDVRIPYDYLLVATGARHHYFGNHHWETFAPGLKTVEDAVDMRRRILIAFEEAERETDPVRRAAWMTFAVVGAGPTGVELAGALGELAGHTLQGNFRSIDPGKAKVILIEGADRVLPGFAPVLSAKAARALTKLGVTVHTGASVTDLNEESVTCRMNGREERIGCRTILWAAGVSASPLAAELAKGTGAKLDRAGRIEVEPDLSLPGHPEIMAIGDMVHYDGPGGQPLPGVAQVAIQQGCYAAKVILARLEGQTLPPFRYHDKGSLAVIGRSAAVADLGWVKFGGLLAWLAWLLIHLMYLIAFSNRLLVMTQWAANYFTRNRYARLITGEENVPPEVE
jgi:NADH dehydrogenase